MASFKQKFQTAEEIIGVIDELETEEAIDAVVILPEVEELTDEEEIEDSSMILNAGGEVLPGDMAGTVELHTTLQDGFDISEPEPAENYEEANEMRRPEQKKKPKARWRKCGPKYINTPKNLEDKCAQEIRDKFGSLTPVQVFELFLDNSILDEIVDFSVKYARSKNNQTFYMRRSELKKFIGILIFSGYHSLPQSKFYWSLDEDKGVPLIRKTMPRNRFEEVKKYIHLSDNDQLDKSDKFSKIRPFLNHLNRRFIQFGVFSHKLSIGEEMIPYFGRHSAKMFIRGKPVRFGFKLWGLASSEGYMYQFEPYGGPSPRCNEDLSLEERVVTNLLKCVPDPENHVIFFGKFFTSHHLLILLSEMKFFAAGTVKENRMASCPFQTVKNFAKEPKGSYDYRYDSNNNLFAVRWRDNSVVTVLTNFGTIQPTIPVRRYNYKEKRTNMVPQPNIIHHYNKGMGGVDLHDSGVANYGIRIRGKKWWWAFFSNGIDSAVVNAWKIHQMATGSAISQVDFRSQVALSLLKAESGLGIKSKNKNLGHSSEMSLPEAVRDDNIDHVIVRNEENARRRCKVCKSQTIYKCKKCQVFIHVECFSKYHE